MEEGLAPVLRPMRGKDLLAAQRHRQRQLAAGYALGQAQDIRHDPGMVAGQKPPGAAPAGHHLIGDQQHAVADADFRHFGQQGRGVEQHPPVPRASGSSSKAAVSGARARWSTAYSSGS